MTTLREALVQARSEFSELPAGEIRREIDNILKDESITDIDGWVIDECHNYPVDAPTEPF